jgi:23S rRNA (uracil1939-C5)-methyltransferase
MPKTGCNPLCPGCRYNELTLSDSLTKKVCFSLKALEGYQRIVSDTLTADQNLSLAYRRKACLHAEWIDNQWIFGLRKRLEIIPIPDCPIHHPFIKGVIQLLKTALPGPEVLPLKFIVVSGKQVSLVLKTKNVSAIHWLTAEFISIFFKLGGEGFWFHYHPSAGRKVFGKGGWKLMAGTGFSLINNRFRHGPSSFQQQILPLYFEALSLCSDFFSPTGNSSILDLYSGIGISVSVWKSMGANVLGVELGGEEIEFARINNPEVDFLRGTCQQRLPQIELWLHGVASYQLFANPPRMGLGEELLDWISTHKPVKLAYLSCSPASLNRDLNYLVKKGFHVEKIIPFDFFPFTRHIENLAFLTRSES